MRNSFRLAFAACATLSLGLPLPAGSAPEPGADAPRNYVQHLRYVESDLMKLGDGSVEAGMNAVGADGYALFAVTSRENGASGWFIFKRPPVAQGAEPPRYAYRILQGSDLSQGRPFAEGMAEFERGGWELQAFTTTPTGALGWYYFMRDATGPR